MSIATEMNKINNAFANLKGERFTPSDVEKGVQEYISNFHPFQIAHLEERKQAKVNGRFVKSKWAIVYDWNDTLEEDIFNVKDDAKQALESYISIMSHDPAIKCRNVLMMDRIRVQVVQNLKNEYASKVGNVQSRQANILAHEAKKSVKSMMKAFRR